MASAISTRFLLAQITYRLSFDVIAIRTVESLSAFVDYCESNNIDYQHTTPEDAAKLLSQGDGAGCGCFTTSRLGESFRSILIREAIGRQVTLINLIGSGSIFQPIELTVSAEETNGTQLPADTGPVG